MPRVLLVLGSVIAGAAAGGASTTAGVWASTWFSRDAVLLGNGIGVLLAPLLAWTCSTGLEETWRRAAVAVVASFGAMAAGIASYLLGTSSLGGFAVPVYFAVLVSVSVGAARITRRQRQALAATPT
jgi:hypothetical protein